MSTESFEQVRDDGIGSRFEKLKDFRKLEFRKSVIFPKSQKIFVSKSELFFANYFQNFWHFCHFSNFRRLTTCRPKPPYFSTISLLYLITYLNLPDQCFRKLQLFHSKTISFCYKHYPQLLLDWEIFESHENPFQMPCVLLVYTFKKYESCGQVGDTKTGSKIGFFEVFFISP